MNILNSLNIQIFNFSCFIITAPPEFLNPAQPDLSVLEGDSITLDCASGGIPKPIVTWGHDDSTLNNGGRYDIQSIGKLTISNTRGSDAGAYACMVRSKAGHRTRDFELTVKGRPGIPKKLEIGVQNTIVFARWQRGYDGGAVQSFEIWGRLGHKDDDSWRRIEGIASQPKELSESKKFQLTSLFEDEDIPKDDKVTYFFSARAKNMYGQSGFSRVVKVVILPSEQEDVVAGELIPKFILGKLKREKYFLLE